MSTHTIPTAQRIATQARESAAELRRQGWTADPSAYTVGAFPGDVEALDARMGCRSTRGDQRDLEILIRRELAGEAS